MPTKAKAKALEFKIVDPKEIPPRVAKLSPAAEELLAGETLFIEGKGQATRFVPMAKKRGFRVRSRTAERDGVTGTYVWLELREK